MLLPTTKNMGMRFPKIANRGSGRGVLVQWDKKANKPLPLITNRASEEVINNMGTSEGVKKSWLSREGHFESSLDHAGHHLRMAGQHRDTHALYRADNGKHFSADKNHLREEPQSADPYGNWLSRVRSETK